MLEDFVGRVFGTWGKLVGRTVGTNCWDELLGRCVGRISVVFGANPGPMSGHVGTSCVIPLVYIGLLYLCYMFVIRPSPFRKLYTGVVVYGLGVFVIEGGRLL